MKPMRSAMLLIWIAYGALALATAVFAVVIKWIRPTIGVVLDAVVLWGVCGTVCGVVLLSGSALGTFALVKEQALRRPLAVATVVAGWLGGVVVGWIMWSFWTNS